MLRQNPGNHYTRSGKSKSDAVYQLGDWDSDEATAATWKPANTTNYVVWEGTDANTFYGVYPYSADYDEFTIPDDQRTDALLTTADWMTATYSGAKSAGSVNLAFQHLLTKVTAKITTWNNEFDPDDVTIVQTDICSKGSAVTATYSKDATTGATTPTITSDEDLTAIISVKGGTAANPTYTAIVAPNGKYAANDEFVLFYFPYKTLTVLAKANVLTDGLEPGKHYTFNITVGKNKAEISSVTVTDWTPQTIDGGVAE